MSQYVFNKKTRECNPWYPQLEIIRTHHPEMIFGIPAELAEQLKDRAFAEKWLRTANINNGNYVSVGMVYAAAHEPEPPDLGEDEDDDIPPEFGALDPQPATPPPLAPKRARVPKKPKNPAPVTDESESGGEDET